MSRHNYTNPAFCQQSEFYPTTSSQSNYHSPIKVHRSESVRSSKQRHQPKNILSRPLPPTNRHEMAPRPGPKPVRSNSSISVSTITGSRYEHIPDYSKTKESSNSGRYALVPVEQICNEQKDRYAVIPLTDTPTLLKTNSKRYTKSQDDLDRYSSCGNDNSNNDLEDSFLSLPPQLHESTDNGRIQAAFSSDFGNKSLILVDQKNMQRYAIVPTEDDEELVDANHEIIQMHNGRAHRYAVIPTDEEETCLSEELNEKYLSTKQLQHNYATVNEAYSPKSSMPVNKIYSTVHQTPQKNRIQTTTPSSYPGYITPTKNPIATQKLHELLSTPQKMNQTHRRSITPNQRSHQNRTQIICSTPKQSDFTPQKLQYDRDHLSNFEHRSTAIISPRLAASTVLYTESITPPNSLDKNKSWSSTVSFQRVANATATIGAVSLMLMLCGAMNSGLCLYMITDIGRSYYLDLGIVSGFAAVGLGLLGFKSRKCNWLPNRNYISGYILVTVFSLLNCCGLLVLLALRPIPGSPIHDVTTGVTLGLSSLTLLLISLGVVTSRWCRAPPPDNRVDVY